MGVYVFNANILKEAVTADANNKQSSHDFGKDIIPELIRRTTLFCCMFRDENKKDMPYWRDVGTLDSYWEANMDREALTQSSISTIQDWPIRTHLQQHAAGEIVFGAEGVRFGAVVPLNRKCWRIVSGGLGKRSVLSPNVRVNSYSHIKKVSCSRLQRRARAIAASAARSSSQRLNPREHSDRLRRHAPPDASRHRPQVRILPLFQMPSHCTTREKARIPIAHPANPPTIRIHWSLIRNV